MTSVTTRLEQPGPKRVLSLDAPGARAVVQLALVQELEAVLAARSPAQATFRLSDYFDLIVGAGLGAAAAAGLARGMTARAVAAPVLALQAAIWASQKPRARGPVKLNPQALAEPLAALAGVDTMAGTAWATGFAALVRPQDAVGPHLVTNAPGGPLWAQAPGPGPYAGGVADAFLAEIVRASLGDARPVQLSPGAATTRAEAPGVLSDPSLEALMTATLPSRGFGWKPGREHLFLVSVGAGVRADAGEAGDMDPLERAAHDASLVAQQALHALSEPVAPRLANPVLGDLRGELAAPVPALGYQRLDVRLGVSALHDELGVSMRRGVLKRLWGRAALSGEGARALEGIGQAASRLVTPDLFPARYNPSGFPVTP